MIATARRRLPAALTGNPLMRIAGGASGVLVGLYLADLVNHGARLDAALVGTLGAVSFGGELLFSIPRGRLPDAFAGRVMTVGALLGAVVTQLFGMSGWVSILFPSRRRRRSTPARAFDRCHRRLPRAIEPIAVRERSLACFNGVPDGPSAHQRTGNAFRAARRQGASEVPVHTPRSQSDSGAQRLPQLGLWRIQA